MDKKASQPGASASAEARRAARVPYMQNRELSWLTFDERCLEQGADTSVPLFERQQFVSIFTSNLQEFFMVRVGSLTDLALLKREIIDTKSNMTPREQLDAIYTRCHELYPKMELIYQQITSELAEAGVRRLSFDQLTDAQREAALTEFEARVSPFLSPQIINARHPFPHLENGALYIIVRLIEEEPREKADMTKDERAAQKAARKALKDQGAEGVTLALIPLPKQAPRVIKLPGEGFNYILVEDLIEACAKQIFNMYTVKHTNVICVTRNADLDATEGADEREEDYREHMKKILKKRGRLAPVRLESKRKLSTVVSDFLLARLNLAPEQAFVTRVPFDMGFAFAMPGMVDADTRTRLTSTPLTPAWPGQLRRSQRIIEQVQDRDIILSYPYESMDPFVQMLREAAADPDVVSIKITLYRLASSSGLADALISAAEAGKEVTALFELRARFDESNNIAWSQRFEDAGCHVIYGFHDYKVHSKICCITRQTPDGLQHITQLGTGNYNEKTAKLYTDFSFITTDEAIGQDAVEFFRNMQLENASSSYQTIWVAPLQIKQNILAGIDEQIMLAREGKPCGLFFKTNSVTDRQVIEKIAEASQAGVPVTLLVRGISCLVPQMPGYTDNVHVVSIVGRLLEHSRIYGFGARENMRIYCSSADLMTRNMDKRVEIAWPITSPETRERVFAYIDACMADNVKLRELRPDGTYTPLGAMRREGDQLFNAQEYLIAAAAAESARAHEDELSEKSAYERLSMQAREKRRDEQRARAAHADLEEMYREALKHDTPDENDAVLQPYVRAAVAAVNTMGLGGSSNATNPNNPAFEAAVAAAVAAALQQMGAQPAAQPAAAPAPEPAPAPAPEPAPAPAPAPAAAETPAPAPAAPETPKPVILSASEESPAPASAPAPEPTFAPKHAAPAAAASIPLANGTDNAPDDLERLSDEFAEELAAIKPSISTLESIVAEASALFADAPARTEEPAAVTPVAPAAPAQEAPAPVQAELPQVTAPIPAVADPEPSDEVKAAAAKLDALFAPAAQPVVLVDGEDDEVPDPEPAPDSVPVAAPAAEPAATETAAAAAAPEPAAPAKPANKGFFSRLFGR